MFQLLYTKAFQRDVKRYLIKGQRAKSLEDALAALRSGQPLSPWLHDHALQGKLRHYRELHVESDWLLVYEKDGKALRILCLWLTTHKRLKEQSRL